MVKQYGDSQVVEPNLTGENYNMPVVQPDLTEYETGWITPDSEDVEEYLEVKSETVPFMPILRGVKNALFTHWEDDVREEYSTNPDKFYSDKEEIIKDLKDNDFFRGFSDEVNFGAFADNPDYVQMTGSGMETMGSMTAMISRDVAIASALSWVPGINFDTVMMATHGITEYRRAVGAGESTERAIQAGLSGGLAMGAGLGIAHGTGAILKGLGSKLPATFMGNHLKGFWGRSLGAHVMGGAEMTSWVGSEHYMNRILRNGMEMTFNPQEFSYDGTKSAEGNLMREREGEEPISAETMAMLFVTGGVMRNGMNMLASPIKYVGDKTKSITNARKWNKQNDRIDEALINNKFNINPDATMEIDDNGIKDFVNGLENLFASKQEPATIIREAFNGLPPQWQSKATLLRIRGAFWEKMGFTF